VRCPECGTDVPPLRLFCPECGAPTDPDMRERRKGAAAPGGGGDDLSRRRKAVIVGAAAVLGLALLGKANWFDFDWDSDDHRRGPAVISAQEVYQAYRDDAGSAARRFEGREMVVSGEFVRVVPDGQGNPDLRLKTANPEAPLGVDLVGISHERATELRPGQRVTVSCQRMAGSGDDRWLQNCAIQDANSRPRPPGAPPPPEAPEGSEPDEER